jgi:hypothetical protein
MAERGIKRNDRTVFRRLEAGAGGVLLHLDTGEYRRLNETGALIWGLLEEAPTHAQLMAGLRRVVEEPPTHLQREVDTFLDSLEARGLIERLDR